MTALPGWHRADHPSPGARSAPESLAEGAPVNTVLYVLALALAVLTATVLTAAPIAVAPVRTDRGGALCLPYAPPRPRRQ